MPSPLLTDLYQLTMAYGYWQTGKADQEAVFHLFFRRLPFRGGYAVAAGLGSVREWLDGFRFAPDELRYLRTLTGRDGQPLFADGFLEYLRDLRFTCDVDALPEGTMVFGHEPIVRIRGPILQAQLIETALLCIVNFQTLIATKAARVCQAAAGEPVLEFGLRRAQGPDGGLMASRAAYLGGCAATSNVLAGMRYDIPVRGTHAHSWVLSFASEAEAFTAWADAMPNNGTFLVDTYDTLEGVRHAIEAGRLLRERGHDLAGVRLDSGDLAWLSVEARRLLDDAGFPDAAIVASNDLDERLIESLKHQGARISVWGVGTKLVTGGEQSALGGVYKPGAVRAPDGTWEPRMKLSEQPAKMSIPGILQVRRFFREDGSFLADAIWDELTGAPDGEVTIVDPERPDRRRSIPAGTRSEDLLQPVYRAGKSVGPLPSLTDSQARARSQLAALHPTVRRFDNPHTYPAGIESTLAARRMELAARLKTPG